jgi:hypothetical protein
MVRVSPRSISTMRVLLGVAVGAALGVVYSLVSRAVGST